MPDGTQTHRNTWKVQDAGELAYSQLERRLSRSGVKETTLDYTRDFAERRGIAEQMGVRSEIEIPAERAGLRAERESTAGDHALIAEILAKVGADLAQDLRADPREGSRQRSTAAPQSVRGPETRARRGGREPRADRAGEDGPQIDQKRPQQAEKQRRGMFAGLKLNARPAPLTGAARHRGCATAGKGRELAAGAGARPAGRAGAGQSPLEQAVDRYSRAYQSIDQHRREGLPVLDMQRQEMGDAGQQLDQVRDGMKDLMRSTCKTTWRRRAP